jgi:hypothetical protein
VGDELTLKLPAKRQGKYNLNITVARTPDSGKFSASVGDNSVAFRGFGKIVDLYEPSRVLARVINAEARLRKGDNTLTLRYEGAREKGARGVIGIDYIWLRRQ